MGATRGLLFMQSRGIFPPATNLYLEIGFERATVMGLDGRIKDEAKMTSRQRSMMDKWLSR